MPVSFLRNICLLFALFLTLPAASLAAVPASTIDVAAALADLNAMRVEAGLQPVAFSDANNDACRAHNAYMSLNGLTHVQNPSATGYTAAGATAGVNSVLAYPSKLPRDSWHDAVYHRTGLLQPRLRLSGYDAFANFTCLRTGDGIDNSVTARTQLLSLYPWPAPGATDVPLAFGGNESPAPANDAGGDTSLGYLLSVNVNGPWVHHALARPKISSASLTPDGGPSAAISVSDSSSPNGSYLDGGFGIFPRDSLAAGTWYTARAKGSIVAGNDSYPFNRTWRFKTTGTQSTAVLSQLNKRGSAVSCGKSIKRPCKVKKKLGLRVRVAISPATAGRKVTVTYFQRVGRKWKQRKSSKAVTKASGSLTFNRKKLGKGLWMISASAPGSLGPAPQYARLV